MHIYICIYISLSLYICVYVFVFWADPNGKWAGFVAAAQLSLLLSLILLISGTVIVVAITL